ncbi:9856_t:CDS:1, partial [Diversispora eburnea]
DQRTEIEKLKKQLQKAYEDIAKIHDLYNEQHKKNEILIRQQNSQFINQQECIKAIIKIANAKRESLFNDIESLIRDNNKFSIESLITYTSREWFNKRNQVAIKFIETLVHNNQDNTLSQEKIFKTAVAIDTIYGARHGKYVSEIQLVALAIKYSIARSKMIINIDNHITSSGSYYRFQKWLEELSENEESLPEGLLFLTFDNEQRGQKNYLIEDLI